MAGRCGTISCLQIGEQGTVTKTNLRTKWHPPDGIRRMWASLGILWVLQQRKPSLSEISPQSFLAEEVDREQFVGISRLAGVLV
jgi:hypothetical protein